MLKPWDKLPPRLRLEEVKPYYDVLARKKASLFFKRLFDIAVSFIMLILLFPVFLILAAAVKLDSPGAVFFRQTRITQYGKAFRIIKFRTMTADAEKQGGQVSVKNDSRITGLGSRFLRRCRLDEISQLFNVLSGSMSFVGTRPEVPKYVNHYTPEMMATLLLPAGITSKASIMYKDEDRLLSGAEDADRTYIEKVLPEKMKLNLEELKNFSLLGDVKTMFATVKAVLKGEGRSKG